MTEAITVREPLSIVPEEIDQYNLAKFIMLNNIKPFIFIKQGRDVVTYVFDGKRYVEDPVFEPFRNVVDIIEGMIKTETNYMNNAQNYDLQEAARKKVERLKEFRCLSGYNSIEKLISKLSTRPQVKFDHDRRYICLENKVLDVVDLCVEDHDPKYLLTKTAPVVYDEAAVCPEIDALINNMYQGDQELIDFADEVMAIVFLRGMNVNHEHFFIFWGLNAGNGKTTLWYVLAKMLGIDPEGYASWLDPKTVTTARTRNATQPELMDTSNKCLAVLDDPNTDQVDISVLKNLANMLQMMVRGLYKDKEMMNTTATFIYLCNRLPVMDTKDAGMARRPVVIPVKGQVTEAMKNKPRVYEKARYDKFVEYLYQNEASGLLNRLLRALKRYKERGYRLPAFPKAVREATEEFILKNNVVKQFIDIYCTVEPSPDRPKHKPFVMATDLHTKLWDYCKYDLNQEKVMQANNIAEVMESMGFKFGPICDERTGRRSMRVYDGIRFKTDQELELYFMKKAGIQEAKPEVSLQEKTKILHDMLIAESKTTSFEVNGTRYKAARYDNLVKLAAEKGISKADVDKQIKTWKEIGEVETMKTSLGEYIVPT